MSWFSDVVDRWTLKKAYKWGRSRAKMKLFAFYSVQDAHPEMPLEDLYYLTILMSRGFDEHRTHQLITRTKQAAEGYMMSPIGIKAPVPVEPFCLRSVVKSMLSAEIFDLFKGKPPPHPYWTLESWKAVDDVIPADL